MVGSQFGSYEPSCDSQSSPRIALESEGDGTSSGKSSRAANIAEDALVYRVKELRKPLQLMPTLYQYGAGRRLGKEESKINS